MSPHKNNIIPTCRICGRRIAEDQENEYCLACQDQMLLPRCVTTSGMTGCESSDVSYV